MKFNCDFYKDWKHKRGHAQEEYLRNWHKKFAWLPIKVADKDCRWFEFVERSYPSAVYSTHYETIFHRSFPKYRAIQKELSKENPFSKTTTSSGPR